MQTTLSKETTNTNRTKGRIFRVFDIPKESRNEILTTAMVNNVKFKHKKGTQFYMWDLGNGKLDVMIEYYKGSKYVFNEITE